MYRYTTFWWAQDIPSACNDDLFSDGFDDELVKLWR